MVTVYRHRMTSRTEDRSWRLGRGLEAEAGASFVGDQGIVHLEELGGLGVAGQPQHAGERPAPGVPGDRDHVVVELAGQEHLMRGRLDFAEQFVGALLTTQRRTEVRLTESGPQRAGEVALGQVTRAAAA